MKNYVVIIKNVSKDRVRNYLNYLCNGEHQNHSKRVDKTKILTLKGFTKKEEFFESNKLKIEKNKELFLKHQERLKKINPNLKGNELEISNKSLTFNIPKKYKFEDNQLEKITKLLIEDMKKTYKNLGFNLVNNDFFVNVHKQNNTHINMIIPTLNDNGVVHNLTTTTKRGEEIFEELEKIKDEMFGLDFSINTYLESGKSEDLLYVEDLKDHKKELRKKKKELKQELKKHHKVTRPINSKSLFFNKLGKQFTKIVDNVLGTNVNEYETKNEELEKENETLQSKNLDLEIEIDKKNEELENLRSQVDSFENEKWELLDILENVESHASKFEDLTLEEIQSLKQSYKGHKHKKGFYDYLYRIKSKMTQNEDYMKDLDRLINKYMKIIEDGEIDSLEVYSFFKSFMGVVRNRLIEKGQKERIKEVETLSREALLPYKGQKITNIQ